MNKRGTAAAIISAMTLSGCVGGDTAVLFTTNNLGLNVQAMPTPTAEISFSRQEGLFAPVFEDGNTIPTAASMKQYIVPFLPISTDSGTVFAGGQTAQQLATDPTDTSQRAAVTCVSEAPKDSSGNRLPEKGRSRPMFFGTTTSIGFRVTMPASNAGTLLPNVHLGYRRNEMAVVPLMGEEASADCTDATRKYAIKSPEFLAVSASGTAAPTVTAGADPSGGKFNVSQIFATGRAAHAAAYIPKVGQAFREAVGTSTETATKGTVSGTFAPDSTSQCLDKWRRDGSGQVVAARNKDINDWITAKRLDADLSSFINNKENASNRTEFLKAKSDTCA